MTKTFGDLGVEPALCDALTATGITHPFPIQELTLPLALAGHDLIGQARTGTGKTLAFGLPLLQRLDPTKRITQALVVVPTRELCLQVSDDLQIGAAKDITLVSVYGGVGYDEQIDALRGGVHVVVGTPGRLLDLLNRGTLDLSHVSQLVLDEADEMLDMGFLPDVERLIEACNGERHTMLFSATMPTAIVKLARRYLDHPTFTRADAEPQKTVATVEQHFLQVHRMDKPRVLARILQSPNRGGVYVFVRTKHMADRLVNELEQLGVPAIPIHGDLRQSSRERNMDRFRAGKATVLVATEVAARGLDVTGVTHVVNYDCPEDEKMYLHRIGRTARAGEAGVAVTFAEFNEVDRLNVIRKAVGATNAQVEQVFSTSDVLTELFDLPEETPWGQSTKRTSHDSRTSRPETSPRPGEGGRERSRDDDRDRRDRDAQRRRGRSDGRPKSGRRAEGSGGDHDATRTRSPDASARERVRTRTRERPDRSNDATEAPKGTGSGSDRQGTGNTSGGRDRQRRGGSGSGARDRAGERSSEAGESSAGSERDRGAPSSGGRQRARTGRRREGGGQSRRQQPRASDSDDAGNGTPSGSRTTTRGRSGSAGATRTTARGTGGRGSSRDSGDTDDVKLERRGRDARGGGQPQLARRVKVEHLP